MKKKLLVAAMGAAAMLAQPALAERGFDDRWHLGVSGGYVVADSERETDDSYHVGLNIGRFFTPNLSVDFRVDRYTLGFDRIPPSRGEQVRLTSTGALARFHFLDADSATRPYVLVGGGMQHNQSFLGSEGDLFGSGGVGVMHRFNDRMFLRAEVEARYDNNGHTLGGTSGVWDVLGTLGLNMRVGSAPTPPPPPPPTST